MIEGWRYLHQICISSKSFFTPVYGLSEKKRREVYFPNTAQLTSWILVFV